MRVVTRVTQLPLGLSLRKRLLIVTSHGFSYGEGIHELANAKLTQLVGSFPI